jgi:hypothetical protein
MPLFSFFPFFTLLTFQVNMMAISFNQNIQFFLDYWSLSRSSQGRYETYFLFFLLSPRISWFLGDVLLGWDESVENEWKFMIERNRLRRKEKLWFHSDFLQVTTWWDGSIEICGNGRNREGNPGGQEVNDLFTMYTFLCNFVHTFLMTRSCRNGNTNFTWCLQALRNIK